MAYIIKYNNLSQTKLPKLRICKEDGCIIEQIEEKYTVTNENLYKWYPFLKPRIPKTKTWFQKYILGSAVVAALRQIIIIYLISVGISFFLIYQIIPDFVFPIDDYPFN